MPTFLHAADLHVDSPLQGLEAYPGAPAERLREATRKALENLVELAIREKVAAVLIAGDVYDVEPLLESALFFRQQMQKLADARIRVAIVRGNHDHEGIAPKSLALPDNVHVFAADRAESIELAPRLFVHGRSYPRRDVKESTFVDAYPSSIPGALNVGLLHTALGGFAEHEPYAPTSPERLWQQGYGYWALGHVHRRLELLDRPLGEGGVPIVFPGNLQGRHAKELGAKGAMLVDYEGTRVTGLRFEPLDVLRWHHLELDVATAPREADPGAWVRDRVFDQTTADRDEGRFCAVRVSVRGIAEGRALQLTSTGLREYLMGELQAAADGIWLEKVRVDVRPATAEASTFEATLRALADELVTSDDAIVSLRQALEPVRKQLHPVDAGLVRELDVPLGEELAQPDDAARILSRAIDLLRTHLA